MDATDMLDVLHYYFEEDLQAATEEESNAKSEMRSVVYRTLYGTTYKYGNKKSGNSQKFSDGSDLPDDGFYGDLNPFDPSETNVTKSYVPATEMDADSPLPFGQILDAPLN